MTARRTGVPLSALTEHDGVPADRPPSDADLPPQEVDERRRTPGTELSPRAAPSSSFRTTGPGRPTGSIRRRGVERIVPLPRAAVGASRSVGAVVGIRVYGAMRKPGQDGNPLGVHRLLQLPQSGRPSALSTIVTESPSRARAPDAALHPDVSEANRSSADMSVRHRGSVQRPFLPWIERSAGSCPR